MLDYLRSQARDAEDVEARIPLTAGYLYTFDGTSFARTSKPFARMYAPGEIDGELYYTIWPKDAELYDEKDTRPGDFVYLANFTHDRKRRWWQPPTPHTDATGPTEVLEEYHAARRAGEPYPRLMASTIKSTAAFSQLTQGWTVFDNAVHSNLVKSQAQKDTWAKLPRVTA